MAKWSPEMAYEFPPGRACIPPEGGWKEGTFYLVDVAHKSTNPVHKALLHVVFLRTVKKNEKPPRYGTPVDGVVLHTYGIWQHTYKRSYEDFYYLRAVKEIGPDRGG
jgi:hypothetical protein